MGLQARARVLAIGPHEDGHGHGHHKFKGAGHLQRIQPDGTREGPGNQDAHRGKSHAT